MTPELIKAIAVTAKLMGTPFDDAMAEVFAEDLAAYPEHLVIDALKRCRREVRGRLVVADVVSRIDDGRPGVEEAWALIPKDEARSGVWTEDMQRAMLVAGPLLAEGDTVAARMAFKEAYTRECQQARDEGRTVKWMATLGHAKAGREEAQHDAMNRNRKAQGLPALPYQAPEHALPDMRPRLQLVGPQNAGDIAERVLAGAMSTPAGRRALADLREKLGGKKSGDAA